MASVYKTVSGAEAHERDVVEKKNKQRVLILVLLRLQRQNTPILTAPRVPEVSPSATAICCRICTRSCMSTPRAFPELIFPFFLLTLYRPHSRKEAKLDTKTKLYQLNELAGTN